MLCAGPWADRLAVAAGADPDPRIVPFRGAYLRLGRERAELVRANIYPVPDPDLPFLGMHLTRNPRRRGPARPDGALRRCPRRLPASPGRSPRPRREPRLAGDPADDAEVLADRASTEMRHAVSMRSFVDECRRYVPELRLDDVERSAHSGVRAQAIARDGSLIDDFVVSETEHAVHVRNAPSPAATSSLALAELIADRVDAIS